MADAGPSCDQMLVNEALVAKIYQCERAETALRESQQRLHDLLIHQLQLKEEERKRMSTEIHNALDQNLMALRLDVATLSQVTGERPPRLNAWVRAALISVVKVRGSAHSRDLRCFEITDEGIVIGDGPAPFGDILFGGACGLGGSTR